MNYKIKPSGEKILNELIVQVFRQMYEFIDTIMLLINQQTSEIIYANKSEADFYGVSKLELCGLPIQQIYTIPLKQVELARQSVMKEGRKSCEFCQRLATGENRYVEEVSSVILWNDKQALFNHEGY